MPAYYKLMAGIAVGVPGNPDDVPERDRDREHRVRQAPAAREGRARPPVGRPVGGPGARVNGRLRSVLLVGLVVVMINLPFVHSSWQDHRIDADGVDVTATVTDTDEDGGSYFVTFRVDESADQPAFGGHRPGRARRPTSEAVETGQVGVRVLPGSTTVWRVEGESRSRVGLVITVVADLCLLVMLLLLMRFGSRLHSDLVLVATEDLERCPPGSVLDQVDGLRFVVCGEVEEIEDDAVVLDLGDRRVRVVLDGHHNPAGYQQPVRATGTMRG